MIEVTDEMVQAFVAGAGWPAPPWKPGDDVREGLAAVLAIVERDFLTPYFCPASNEVESPCHGGFDVCCDRPDLHRRPPETTP